MNSTIDAPNVSAGWQEPRVFACPEFDSSAGAEVVELCAMAGLNLDPWQRFVLYHALGERVDGTFASFEVGIEISRQNGKGGCIEARELAGLYLLGERLIIHSAHEFATSLEAFHRLLLLIESSPDLERRVKRVSRSHGEEGIELKGGQRIRYRTRTGGGGRGFTGDCLILDEAMIIPERMHGSLFPTLSARPNPQVWYTGSAVDQESMEHGIVFSRIRERGMKGGDPSLAWFGWEPPYDHPDAVPSTAATDPEVWAQANPALGIRISHEHVAREQRSMDPRTFAVERLGVGDWPATDGSAGRKITDDQWEAVVDINSEPVGAVCFAFDVTPDRRFGCIAVAGRRKDGLSHIEVVDLREGTGWIKQRVIELAERHDTGCVTYSSAGPAASIAAATDSIELAVALTLAGHEVEGDLEARLSRLRVELKPAMSQDETKACSGLYDAVADRTVRHLGTTDLSQALKGAATRPLGDSWAWARRTSRANIAPLVACTLALWGLQTMPKRARVQVVSLADA